MSKISDVFGANKFLLKLPQIELDFLKHVYDTLDFWISIIQFFEKRRKIW